MVALSVNVNKIVAYRHLPARAGAAAVMESWVLLVENLR